MTKVKMTQCIKSSHLCLGRDSQKLPNIELCCKDEIEEEKAIVQSAVDAINDCTRNRESLQKVSSKLSFLAQVINKNDNTEFIEVFSIIHRFSILIYEFQEKILNDTNLMDLSYSFTNELKKWFTYSFLRFKDQFLAPVSVQSITADINTIEMALGVCMLTEDSSSLDDLFF